MSGRTSLLRFASDGPYIILGTDFPSARVFNTGSSTLAATVQLPARHRSLLSTVRLTALTLGTMPADRTAANRVTLANPTTHKTGAVDITTPEHVAQTVRSFDQATGMHHTSESQATTGVTMTGLTHAILLSHYAAVGLSDGTVMLHDIERDELIDHLSVSPTQQPVQALAFAGHYLLCLCADHVLSVIDVWHASRGVQMRAGVVRDATALTASLSVSPSGCSADATSAGNMEGSLMDNSMQRVAASLRDALAAVRIRILVAGPTTAVYDLHIHHGDNLSRGSLTTVLSFASQGATVDHLWMTPVFSPSHEHAKITHPNDSAGRVRNSDDTDEDNKASRRRTGHKSFAADAVIDAPGELAIRHSHIAVMASAEDGVIQVWDVHPGEDVVVRCRRTLRCGQRIANLAVWQSPACPTSTVSSSSSSTLTPNASAGSAVVSAPLPHVNRTRYAVLATTFTGTVLMWDLGYALLPPVVEPTPLVPTLVLVSAAPQGRLLYAVPVVAAMDNHAATLVNSTNKRKNFNKDNNASIARPFYDQPSRESVAGSNERAWPEGEEIWGALRVLLLRGRFAVPRFDLCDVGALLHQQQQHSLHRPLHSHPRSRHEVARMQRDEVRSGSVDLLTSLGLHMSHGSGDAGLSNPPDNRSTSADNVDMDSSRQADSAKNAKDAPKRIQNDVSILFAPTTLPQKPSLQSTRDVYGWESSLSVTGTRVLSVPLSIAMRSWLHDTQESRRLLHRTLHAQGGGGGQPLHESMDALWAAYSEAAHNTESFRVAHVAPAASVQDLPVNQLTLEQRLQQTRLSDAAVHTSNTLPAAAQNTVEGVPASTSHTSTRFRGALGLATVPLYQAIHANDMTAVVELLGLAAVASPTGMYDMARSLQLPYCLQLLQLLSRRLGVVSAPACCHRAHGARSSSNDDSHAYETEGSQPVRVSWMGGGLAATSLQSSLLAWIDALVQCRGVEMYKVQCAANATHSSAAAGAAHDNRSVHDGDGAAAAAKSSATVMSPPRDFLAPLLHQYRQYGTQYDKLATLYGRLSVFTEHSGSTAASASAASRKSGKTVGDFFNKPRNGFGSNMEMARTPATLSRKMDLKGVLHDDILFPAMFTEVRTRRGGARAVRVRSRVAIDKRQRERATSDRALLHRAKRLARSGGEDKAKSRSTREVDEMDMEALGLDEHDMTLNSPSSASASSSADSSLRGDSARMLAAGVASDSEADVVSGEEEFAASSDDEVHSQLTDPDNNDDEMNSSDEEESDTDDSNEPDAEESGYDRTARRSGRGARVVSADDSGEDDDESGADDEDDEDADVEE